MSGAGRSFGRVPSVSLDDDQGRFQTAQGHRARGRRVIAKTNIDPIRTLRKYPAIIRLDNWIEIKLNRIVDTVHIFIPSHDRVEDSTGPRCIGKYRFGTTAYDRIFSLPVCHARNVAVAFSPDGKHLATTGEENTVVIWDASSGKKLLTIAGHTASVVQITYNPNGTQLATLSENNEDGIKVWDAKTGKEPFTLRADNPIFGLAFSPDGKQLAAVGAGRISVI